MKMPIISTIKNEVIGFEVLLNTFRGIPLAIFNHNTDLFNQLSTPLLDSVFQLDRLGKIREPNQLLFINLTPQQCIETKGFNYLSHYIQKSSIKKNIVVEITEQKCNEQQSDLINKIRVLKSLGYKLAIDDFGVKSSNFQRIFELDPHYIKLDKSIISQFDNNKTSKQYLHEFINFCHRLNKKVIIEGVETEAQLQLAKSCNADYLQGFIFGLPQKIS